VASGPFASYTALIAEIVGGDARIEVQIFGHATPTWIPLDALDPV
jgi:transcription antitermination factor NusG